MAKTAAGVMAWRLAAQWQRNISWRRISRHPWRNNGQWQSVKTARKQLRKGVSSAAAMIMAGGNGQYQPARAKLGENQWRRQSMSRSAGMALALALAAAAVKLYAMAAVA
jgi:hypothetical protein